MKKDEIIERATIQAKRSVNVFKHGACVVYKNKIVGEGCNESVYCIGVNWQSRMLKCSLHAEVSAIRNTPRVYLKDASLYVVRVNENGILKNSFPCENCISIVKKYKIRLVYYSS